MHLASRSSTPPTRLSGYASCPKIDEALKAHWAIWASSLQEVEGALTSQAAIA